jgi:hypothetical protein
LFCKTARAMSCAPRSRSPPTPAEDPGPQWTGWAGAGLPGAEYRVVLPCIGRMERVCDPCRADNKQSASKPPAKQKGQIAMKYTIWLCIGVNIVIVGSL